MATKIKVICIDQVLSLADNPIIASGGINEDLIEFQFCNKWDGYLKTAVFYQQKGEIYYSLVDENNVAVIPHGVIANSGVMYLGVFGIKGEIQRTSKVLRYHIDNGALDGFTVDEPDMNIYQQLLNKYKEILDLCENTANAESEFETSITNQQNTFESSINEQWNNYKAQIPTIAENKATEVVNSQLGNYYKKTETYSSTEIDNKLSSKSNSNHNHDSSYYKKTETYSKTEVDSLIGDIDTAITSILGV